MDKHPALTDPEAAIAWLKGGWHVYTPDNTGGRVHLTQTWAGKNQGKPLCRHSVHNDFGVGFHQCTKLGVEQTADPDKMWWCHIHGPTGKAKRAAREETARKAKEDAAAAARLRALNLNPHIQALLKIAKGDNDPRTTAQEALGELWDKLKDQT